MGIRIFILVIVLLLIPSNVVGQGRVGTYLITNPQTTIYRRSYKIKYYLRVFPAIRGSKFFRGCDGRYYYLNQLVTNWVNIQRRNRKVFYMAYYTNKWTLICRF